MLRPAVAGTVRPHDGAGSAVTGHLLRGADVVADSGLLPSGWLVVDGERITEVGGADRQPPACDRTTDLPGLSVLPGFVDVHVHGGGGDGFGGDEEAIGRAARFHAHEGTTSLVATTVSAPADVLADQVTRLAGLDGQEGGPRLLGIHLEGPFISPARRGAHDAAHLRAYNDEEGQRLLAAAGGRLRLITAAPELDGFARLVRRMSDAGVVVSAGHTDADGDGLLAGISSGARSLTHTFNGMRSMHHRAPGPLRALVDSDVFCELIVDGVHLHPATVRMARHLAGAQRVVLVTDAVPVAGLGPGRHRIGGREVDVRDGGVWLAGAPAGAAAPTLAGSTLTTVEAARRYRQFTGASLVEVAAVASTNPARLLGEDHRIGRIRAGHLADLTLLDGTGHCAAVMVGGRWVRRPPELPAV